MGSCVSVRKEPESSLGLRISAGSGNGELLAPSKVENKSQTIGTDVLNVSDRAILSPFGSKDESFFDSQPWLDSDCEDDFLSVNGDFTPSRGSTPVHPNFFKLNEDNVVKGNLDSLSYYPDKKRRLSDLFEHSVGVHQHRNEASAAGNINLVSAKLEDEANTSSIPPKSTNGTSYLSSAHSQCKNDRMLSNVLREDEKSAKSAQCCLPRLLSSRSLSER